VKAISARIASSICCLSPASAALALSLGVVLGIFPVYGLPTILCLLASVLLGVNFPVLQLVNQICWPLQIAMLVPLARLGSHIIAPSVGFGATFVLQALSGWLTVSIPLGLALYFLLVWALRRRRASAARA
jgi:uncharacterized protein (DUF2062 family)